MMRRVHFIAGGLEAVGGVADYTSVLAGALSLRGVTTHIWDPREPGVRQQIGTVLRREPGPVLVQYVPNAFGWRGANVPFCRWLLSLKHEGHDVRVMFHEPYFYFSGHPLRNALAVIQRAMAAILLRAATVCYVPTENWIRYLTPYAPRGTTFTVLPVPATVGRHRDPAREGHWRSTFLVGNARFLVGHFGTYGEHVTGVLTPIVRLLLRDRADIVVVCVGRGSNLFAESIRRSDPSAASRIVATGSVAETEVVSALRACDLALQPYPDGVTTRRTSIMAAIANDLPTVTSRGFLTEPVWSESGAAVLAQAGDADAHVSEITSLLDDEPRRLALARRGGEFYDACCSIDTTVDALLGCRLAATA